MVYKSSHISPPFQSLPVLYPSEHQPKAVNPSVPVRRVSADGNKANMFHRRNACKMVHTRDPSFFNFHDIWCKFDGSSQLKDLDSLKTLKMNGRSSPLMSFLYHLLDGHKKCNLERLEKESSLEISSIR